MSASAAPAVRGSGRDASRRFAAALLAILAAGTVIRVVLAFATYGDAYDMESLRLARAALETRPIEAFTLLNPAGLDRWPYLSGFFPFIIGADWAADITGLPYHGVVSLPAIAADTAIAWVVQRVLAVRGASPQARLGAAALVAFGPSFIAISAYHGQIDALAVLPGLLALLVWISAGSQGRAWQAGVLIGIGAAVKTMPIVLLLALLPTARHRREGITLCAAAAAVPLLALAPFALAGHPPPVEAASYRGLPGAGGLSLLAQPSLGAAVLGVGTTGSSELTAWLFDSSGSILAIGLLATFALLVRRRVDAVAGAVFVWLAVYAFSANFFFQYLIWGLPFLLAAGYVREVLALQALLVAPTVIFYLRPWERPSVAILYVTAMLAVWAAFAASCVRLAIGFARGRRAAAAEHSSP